MPSTLCRALRPARRLAPAARSWRPQPSPALLPAHARLYATDGPGDKTPGEVGVGELEGAKFKIEPLRRVGEDDKTKRARLLCTSPLPTATARAMTLRWLFFSSLRSLLPLGT